jgi:hypothetical protein
LLAHSFPLVVSREEQARILVRRSDEHQAHPGHTLFATSPSYWVADVMSAKLRLRTPAIRHFFARAGGSASEVPDAWNGAVMEVRIGPVVVADCDGVFLLQSRPFVNLVDAKTARTRDLDDSVVGECIKKPQLSTVLHRDTATTSTRL